MHSNKVDDVLWKYGIRTATKRIHAAWAFGTWPLILRHESKYLEIRHFIFLSSFQLFLQLNLYLLRTDSIILKAIDGSRPAYIK